MKKIESLKIVLLSFVFTLPIYANPVAIGIPFFEPTLHLFLFGEALVIALMLTNYKFYLVRTLISWHIVTFFTFSLFTFVLTMIGDMTINISHILFLISIVILEYLVIAFETTVIQKFSRRQFFNKEPKEMSYREAFKISLIGNLVSIYMGFIGLLKQML